MTKNASATSGSTGNMQRLLVVGIGVVLLILLFFADKTNLNNQDGTTLEANRPQTAASSLPAGKLPPLAPDERLDAWMAEVENTSGDAQKALLDSIVNRLSARKRYAYAASYATRGLAFDSSLQAKRRLGRLNQEASRLEYIAQDTVLFKQYSDQAIAQLEAVTAEAPQDEEALYYLGLAYVESRNPANSMKGILTIRNILQINPDNVEASYSLGMFSMRTGQYDKAIARFEKVLQLQPENQSARFYLANAKLEMNQQEGVVELLETVIQEANNPDLKQQARNLINQIK